MSRALASFAAAARFGDLTTPVLEATQRSVLDWLGSALAGALEPPARMTQAVVATLGSSSDATVFGAGRSAAAHAALANGVSSHILELDDVHKGSTLHAAAPVIPAALAMAEREHRTGEQFLLAVAVGYDVALRVGEAVNPSHYRYWHPTGTAATFGAAAAAGSLLGLDATEMLNALGTAGTQASGLWEFNADGAMSKHLHPGKAASNGILAADLAAQGFTGATRILEGDRGFFAATSTGADASRITDRLGDHWKVTENCFKLHACCGHTHTAIDVSLDYRRDASWTGGEAVDELSSVEVMTYGPGYEIVKSSAPRTPYQAKFSLAYCVAAALLEGSVGLAQFTPERFSESGVTDAATRALLERIRVTVAPELSARYPAEWGTRVTFTRRDGSVRALAAAFPRGNPENAVPTSMLEEKFRLLVAPRYNGAFAERALDAIRTLTAQGDMATAFAGLVT
ncbi:MAG: MmgE/PrpD family protein [Gemmatimonadaceae bacterium]